MTSRLRGLITLLGISVSASVAASGVAEAQAPQITIDTLISSDDATFGLISGGAFLDDSTLVLSDMQARRLVVVPLNGRGTRTISRRGRAPGELELPYALSVHGDTISVVDFGQARVTRFRRIGAYLSGTTYAASLNGKIQRLFQDGTVLVGTNGRGGSLAARARLDGTIIARYGVAPAKPTTVFMVGEINEEAREGRYPEQMKNSAKVSAGVAGDIWLTEDFRGRVQRWSQAGKLLATYQLAPKDLAAAREPLFSDPVLRNPANSGEMPSPSVVKSLLPLPNGAWAVLRRPDGDPPILIRLDANARELRRVELPDIEDLGELIRSPNGKRVIGVVSDEGVVLEVRGLDS